MAFRCPARGFDRFRPFSCKSYLPLGGALRRLCPSCAQERTLLLGEYLFFIPLGATDALSEIWRRSVVALFLKKGLLNPDFARKLLGWEHSGFSIESGTRIWNQESREALCQYILRAPLSLQRIRWDEQQDPVLSDAPKDQAQGGPLHRQVGVLSRRKAGARLLAKVHELDVMACPRRGSRMAVLAVIVDPTQIRKIIACRERHGRGPPLLG